MNTNNYGLEIENMLITDGYRGAFGLDWHTPTADELEKAIVGAMVIEAKSEDEIVAILKDRKTIRWCEAPNFYYNQSYGKLGTKKNAAPVEMITCDCGHTVSKSNVMTTANGTSCQDCYDSMSD